MFGVRDAVGLVGGATGTNQDDAVSSQGRGGRYGTETAHPRWEPETDPVESRPPTHPPGPRVQVGSEEENLAARRTSAPPPCVRGHGGP
ncbi:MAG: hypothetical protein AVDCRST_MAG49-39 [uncultured Thermomicrobiales bacterium]|uniref:Uncharacterized protein n=1 Tax=uncultured Thermomicrobiales bacterium TaxID=1645740 RepID=A0A6J4TV02_9BACT|nr:MAG: hypothetical protein AVDCRST_MAG49-39 [uncultured Thermomicrobiales bacterium]